MKIAYIANALLPSETANSVHVARMVAALARQSVDVKLFARTTGQGDLSEIAAFYGLRSTFPARLFRQDGAWDKRSWRWRSVFQAWREGRIVMTRDLRVAAMASRILPTFMELHHPPTGARGHQRLARVIAQGGTLITITSALADFVAREWQVSRDAIHVLQDGADPVDTLPTPAELHRGRVLCGYAGSLLQGKGAERVGQLAALCPDVDFVVVGGPEERRLELTSQYPQQNLRWLPRVAPAEIPGIIAAFDVALLPNAAKVATHGNAALDIGQWTSPLKAFEYMALERAIVVSDLPNLREVFHADNAVLCPVDDIAAWQAAILRLAQDPELRARLGQAARHDLETLYSWDCRAAQMVRLFAARGPQ
ncbi:glycosyltransferase family 4 protein [Sagittula sp. S175]|uniref:glycosyltransferase family 4 protein n=1 Tax=Sagittula sp. S175 TaxID=3415129 RepID=UPI003C7D119C